MLTRLFSRILAHLPFHNRLKKRKLFRKFKRNFAEFRLLSKNNKQRFLLSWKDRYPCLYEATSAATFDRHYIYHTAWAARILANTKPKIHYDFSSSLYFSTLVSAYIPIVFYDLRPPDLFLSQLETKNANLTCLSLKNKSVHSLSCMHVVEHIGLGRYGDPLEPEGDLKAMKELQRVLANGGDLLFVVPIGTPKIMYNAHRIYSFQQIRDSFDELVLKEFSLLPDKLNNDGLVKNASSELADKQKYACGCFWFTR